MSPTSLQPQIAAMRVTPQRTAVVLLATTVAVAAVVVKAVQIMSLTAVMMVNQWKRGKRKVVETWLTFWKDKNCSLCCVSDRIMELTWSSPWSVLPSWLIDWGYSFYYFQEHIVSLTRQIIVALETRKPVWRNCAAQQRRSPRKHYSLSLFIC